MDSNKVFFNDSFVQVTQSKLIIEKNQYDISSINFVNLVEEFGGFTIIGWLFILAGILTLPFYGVGFIIMLLGYVYFPSKRYAIKIMLYGKETDVLKSKNLEYIKLVKQSIDEAIDLSMKSRMSNSHSHVDRNRI